MNIDKEEFKFFTWLILMCVVLIGLFFTVSYGIATIIDIIFKN